MEELITITFPNGSIEVKEDGCFVTDEPIPENLLSDLSTITITRGEDEEPVILTNQRIIEHLSVDGRYWFSFADEIPVNNVILVLDGMEISATVNGNTYSTNIPLEDHYKKVVIKGDTETTLLNVDVIRTTNDSAYEYSFAEKSLEEMRMIKIESNLDYLSMMSDIDLEEGG